ncbi:MAG: BamA/TamA family outer membrane protein [Bacteroidetes bacterium]|nr:BamA/TamA family outer membrane protein [Bacteroidota bacterium]
MSQGIIVLSLLFAPLSALWAQDSTRAYILDKVFIEGNKTTKDYVILRELPFKPGDTVTSREIIYARERVYDTGLFTKVLVQPEPVSKRSINLLIYVEERWYIWPYPVIGFRDSDLKRFYAGAGLVHLNFQGQDEKLAGMFALGYDPFAAVKFRDPWFGPDREYILSLGASYSQGRNPGIQPGYASGQFNDSFGDMQIEIGRRFGIYSTVTLGTSYNYVAKNSDTTNLVLSPTGTDVFASLKLAYIYDSRNLTSYATRGAYLYVALEKHGLGESLVNFGRFSFDARDYMSLAGMFTLAGRVHANLAEGPQIPPYNHVFIGYYERIRGMFNTVSEGESIVGANMELRIPIIKQMYIEFPELPLRQFVSNRIALYWTFFADAGETTGKRLHINLNGALYGYGGGLALVLPYDVVIQTDYARGSDKRWEFVLDFGAAI